MSNNSDSIAPNNANLKFIADQFARALQELRDAVNNIQTQVQSGAIDMAGVKVEIDNIQEKIDELQEVVRGNHDRSLTAKFIIIDSELKSIIKWIEAQKELKAEGSKYKAQIYVAIIIGFFGLASSLITMLAKFF